MKLLKRTAIVLLVLAALGVAGFKYMTHRTKQASPEVNANYAADGHRITIFYNGPSKKGREIFGPGKLVPFGEVWRTGANETTTFATNQDLMIAGKLLPAGKYSLWTIPDAQAWTVIWNRKIPDWGVTMDSKAAREPEADVLQAVVPVAELNSPVERLDIHVEKDSVPTLVLEWDRCRVAVPLR